MTCSSTIMVSRKINDVSAQVETALATHSAEEILVAFDIDMTLTYFDHPAVLGGALKAHGSIFKESLEPLTNEEKDRFNSFLIHTIPQAVIEDEIPTLLKRLESQHIKTIAFTAALTGSLQSYERMEEKRFK